MMIIKFIIFSSGIVIFLIDAVIVYNHRFLYYAPRGNTGLVFYQYTDACNEIASGFDRTYPFKNYIIPIKITKFDAVSTAGVSASKFLF